MEYTLEQGKRYKAIIELTGFETWATNEMVAQKLYDYGFSEVKVSGDYDTRVAEATWSKRDMTGEIPEQIKEIEELSSGGVRELRDDIEH
ncbi:MAG: hypothetical protein ACO3UU_09460 [Minisyncoccia bacterium]